MRLETLGKNGCESVLGDKYTNYRPLVSIQRESDDKVAAFLDFDWPAFHVADHRLNDGTTEHHSYFPRQLDSSTQV